MSFGKEIGDCLEIIKSLELSFQEAQKQDFLYLSFFSENHDLISKLKGELNKIEAMQFSQREKEEASEITRLEKEEWVIEDISQAVIPEDQLEIRENESELLVQKEEIITTGFLGDIINKKIFSDIRTSLSLNDRFRFQKDLFNNDSEWMNSTLGKLNDMNSLIEVMNYLEDNFSWNWEDESVQAFKELLEKRFS